MFQTMSSAYKFGLCAVFLGISWALIGCGAAEDPSSDDAVGVTQGAVSDRIRILCPTTFTANWIQAANGKTTTISGMSSHIDGSAIPETTNLLHCMVDSRFSITTFHTVAFLGAGATPSLCGAKATITAPGVILSGVPAFGGYTFKSTRLTAATNYNQSTGVCQLDIGMFPNPILSVKVNQNCTRESSTIWSCPAGTLPLN